MEKQKQIMDLLNDGNFISSLERLHSFVELKELFSKHGVEVSLEELEEITSLLNADTSEKELTEDALEDVAGGAFTVKSTLSAMWKAFKAGWKYGSKFYDWERNLANGGQRGMGGR